MVVRFVFLSARTIWTVKYCTKTLHFQISSSCQLLTWLLFLIALHNGIIIHVRRACFLIWYQNGEYMNRACMFPCMFCCVMFCMDVLYIYCMHIYVCICVYVYLHVYIYIYIYIYIYMFYLYVYLYVCIYMYIHLCMYMLVSM